MTIQTYKVMALGLVLAFCVVGIVTGINTSTPIREKYSCSQVVTVQEETDAMAQGQTPYSTCIEQGMLRKELDKIEV